jgi:hypothetical protein
VPKNRRSNAVAVLLVTSSPSLALKLLIPIRADVLDPRISTGRGLEALHGWPDPFSPKGNQWYRHSLSRLPILIAMSVSKANIAWKLEYGIDGSWFPHLVTRTERQLETR